MKEDLQFDGAWCSDLIRMALEEDASSGDATSRAVVPADVDITASIIVGEKGTVAGLPVAAMVFAEEDASVVFQALVIDGSRVYHGQRIAVVQGPAWSILKGERTALNFLQQLSGVATLASQFAAAVSRYDVKIKDTRKTIPGWRALQKYAVRAGGCENHRYALHDQVLIKENHIRCLPGERMEAIRAAVCSAKEKSADLQVEVEVESIEEFRVAADARADIIMLDNVDTQTVKDVMTETRNLGDGRPIIEVSGNVTLENVEEIAKAGPDWISVGCITHSAGALDMSMEVEE